MKKLLALSLLAAAVIGQPVHADTKLRAWNIHPEGYPVTQALALFSEQVEKSTNGRYHIEVHSNGVLGDQPKAVKMMKDGEIDLAEFNLSPLTEAAPGAKVLTLPFLFRDSDHMFRQLDGKLGARFATKLKDAGYVVLGWYDGGSRSFYCANKVVKNPADLKGLRIRVQQSETAIAMVKLLDATPVVVPYKEVLKALKEGTIDCAENNLPAYETTGHMTVAKQFYISNHTVSPEALVVSTKVWDKLTEEDRKAFQDAGRKSAERMRQLWNERTELAKANAAKQGTQFYAMRDYGPLVSRMRPLHEKYFADAATREELFTILAD